MNKHINYLGLALLIGLNGHLSNASERIDPDSVWAIQFNMAVFLETEMGQAMMEQSEHPKMAEKLQFLEENFRLDPWTDFRQLTMYGSGVRGQAVSVARGNFDSEWLISRMESRSGYETDAYLGLQTHRMKGGQDKHLAFIGNNILIVASSEEDLQEAIEIQLGERESGSFGLDNAVAENRGAFYFGFARINQVEDLRRRPLARSIRYWESVVAERDGDLVVGGLVETEDANIASGLLQLSKGLAVLAQERVAGHRHAEALLSSLTLDQSENSVSYEMRLEVGSLRDNLFED